MNKKLLLLLIFLVSSSYNFSQQKNKLISGKIIDSLGTVNNANIVNLNTKQGTFSNDDGVFRIFVSKGDTIRVSSIQHISKRIIVNNNYLSNKNLEILLKINIYTLDTFELKRHNLTGSLSLDVKEVSKNVKDSLLRAAMDFSKLDMSKGDFKTDEIDKMKPPIVNTMAGAMAMAGAGASISMPFKHSERLWALRKKLAQKKAFPYKILSELGEKFFFDELKIPIDKYFHFLEYCNPLGIEDLHKNGKMLDVIKILRRESISYQKIIKNE
jgi:hypothetical protein